MSQDLTYGIFVDTDGVVKTWSTATQTVTSVEATVPRPAGYTALAIDVSNDGRTAHTRLFGPATIERFTDLDSATAVDVPNLDAEGFGAQGYYLDRFVLAADGNAFLLRTRPSTSNSTQHRCCSSSSRGTS